jgi:hypothetical protein
MLPVSAEVRDSARVAAGDELDVTLALDSELRVVAVPPDFGDALARDAQARRFFDGLSYSSAMCSPSKAPTVARPASGASSSPSRHCAPDARDAAWRGVAGRSVSGDR